MKCLSPANFNMTATREGQPLWTEAGWARRMLGTALARGWIRAGGDTPRPPLGFICSHGQAPSPAAHHCSASPTVLPLCRAASSRASATSARTSRSHGCVAGTKLPFLFHLHISAVEEGSDLGTHCRAAEPSSHNTNLNPSLAWRQSCAQLSLSWRETSENPSSTTDWKKCFGEKQESQERSLLTPSLPPRFSGATEQPHHHVFYAAPTMLGCLEMSRTQVLSLYNIERISSPGHVVCKKYKHHAFLVCTLLLFLIVKCNSYLCFIRKRSH